MQVHQDHLYECISSIPGCKNESNGNKKNETKKRTEVERERERERERNREGVTVSDTE